jgi:serine/tyrosine/threonine adenylyltransferase
LHKHKADYTLAFRALTDAADGIDAALIALLGDGEDTRVWLARWRGQRDNDAAVSMRALNPKFIPRNHRVEEALAAATEGDLAPLHTLLKVLSRPFDELPGFGKFSEPPEDNSAPYRTFCGT